MSPQFRRFLPLILIVLVLFTILPLLSRRGGTSGPSAAERSRQTQEAMRLIDRGEQAYRAAHGRYTDRLADLLPGQRRLAADLVLGLSVQLDVSADGKTYVAQVVGDVISLVRSRSGGRLVANNCLVLKTGSGVACPAGTPSTGTTTSTTTG
jgi:type II secretory pathway pseudopilin PulG